ncbi:MAG: TadE/TadG family type IV pilus assembly protein [Pseudomonadota bacterium]
MRETTGNVAVIASLAVIPMITVAGVAVDFQRVITKKNTVQHTIDATVIAAARERQAGRSEGEIRSFIADQFETLLLANDPSLSCTIPAVAFDPESEAIDASVTCSQPTTLTAIVGINQLQFTVNTASTYGIGEVDVAFVFDLSGSMNSSGRLTALKQAALDAVDILLPEDGPSTDEVRLSISTYNHSVNAGRFFDSVVNFNRRSSTIETSEVVGDRYAEDYVGEVQVDARNNRRFYDYERIRRNGGSSFTDFAGRLYYNSSCVYNRTGTEAYTDAAPGDGAYIFAGHPIWDYGANRGEESSSTVRNRKEDGQDEVENQNALARSSLGGDLSFFNDGSSVETEGAYTHHIRLGNSINENFDITGCRPDNEPVPLTSNRSDLRSFINGMRAGGGTAGHLGIAWGWYLLSPNWGGIWPNGSTPHDYGAEDTAKALIIMTDGEFNAVFPREYDPDGVPSNSDRSTALAARYCDNIKAQTNITIFTVGFSVPNNVSNVPGTSQTILEYCASGPQFEFEADSAQELRDAYSQIASQISDLRLAR